ncbi:ABC transporter ATP-binding protein [Candidatus Woesearchaeota archaeon]|nr:ABC transporter ATP-binding protein [Candidatus Woesearchaeota archaeon]
MDLIRLREVTKEYRKRAVLQNVSLTIEEGDIFGVIGQSGSGKTTLLNLIAGFIEPTDGQVVYYPEGSTKEKDLHRNFSQIKRHIGYTPQHNSLYPKLTVQENLWHFGRLYKIDKQTLTTNIRNLLNFTHLFDYRHFLSEQLSGGMQKRLDLSCSLVHKPRLLILDEPTSDLDPILQKEIIHLLQEVNKQGVTIIIASHHLESIENICNKVAIIHQGKVHTHGLMEEVRKPYLKDHFTIRVRSVEQKQLLIDKLKVLPIQKIVDKGNSLVIYPSNIENTMANLLKIIKEENLFLHDLDLRRPSLNEIFEKITTDAAN